MTELVTYELNDRIATIVMDDGKVNAFSIPMLKAVHAALDRAERDGAIVILTGREGYFSAGFDLKVFAGGDVEQVIEMLTLGATLAERILGFATPVITACSGHTVAAGAFMALAADMRIGTDGPFKVGLNEVKIGLTVPWFVIELARQRLNPAHFNRAVVSATMYGPGRGDHGGLPRRGRPGRGAARGEPRRGREPGRAQPPSARGHEAARPRRLAEGDPHGDRDGAHGRGARGTQPPS